MASMAADAAELLQQALTDRRVVRRYHEHVRTEPTPAGCLIWTGAVSGRGHGRFWIGSLAGRDVTVIAHRFGAGLAWGYDSLNAARVIRHRCDNVLCQNPAHFRAGTVAENTAEWWQRVGIPGSPLHDRRGSYGRAKALRDAARSGGDWEAVEAAGRTQLDLYQQPLWDLGADQSEGPQDG